jgi:DNA-binding response OmpR family regulator
MNPRSGSDKIIRILIMSPDENLREVLRFCFDGWGAEVFLQSSLQPDITPVRKISPDVIIMDVGTGRKTHLELCRLLKDDFTTALIPIITLINKRQLRGQLLNLKHGVDDYLIKPPDPLDLRVRVEMAIRRSQYSFFASSLTGLPGGRLIEEVVTEKLKSNKPFTFGYVDIDNFKYFNDVYGYLKGDHVIMQTAYMLYTALKSQGNKDDFIGHIGGDDFVFVTTPDKYNEVCCGFIELFDKIIPFHYSLRDRKRGFVVARDRTHKIKQKPLMSVSVAIVNRRKPGELNSLLQINEQVVEIKHYLKGMPGSKFMADRRNDPSDKLLSPWVLPKQASNKYLPLGQILVDNKFVTSEQLEEALRIHWKRGIFLGEILKELGFLKEAQLKEALSLQTEKISTLN